LLRWRFDSSSICRISKTDQPRLGEQKWQVRLLQRNTVAGSRMPAMVERGVVPRPSGCAAGLPHFICSKVNPGMQMIDYISILRRTTGQWDWEVHRDTDNSGEPAYGGIVDTLDEAMRLVRDAIGTERS